MGVHRGHTTSDRKRCSTTCEAKHCHPCVDTHLAPSRRTPVVGDATLEGAKAKTGSRTLLRPTSLGPMPHQPSGWHSLEGKPKLPPWCGRGWRVSQTLPLRGNAVQRTTPDGHLVTASAERFRCAEVLYWPKTCCSDQAISQRNPCHLVPEQHGMRRLHPQDFVRHVIYCQVARPRCKRFMSA